MAVFRDVQRHFRRAHDGKSDSELVERGSDARVVSKEEADCVTRSLKGVVSHVVGPCHGK